MALRFNLGSCFCSFLLLFVFIACEKPVEERVPEVLVEPFSNYPIAGFQDVDGVLGAIKNVNFVSTDSGVVQYKSRIVQAFFLNPDTAGTFMSAGKVYLDTVLLTANTQKVYSFNDLINYPNGYPFKDTVTWIVGGNIARFINPFSYNTVDMAGYTTQPIIDTNLFTFERTKPFTLKMLNTLTNISPYSGVEVFTVFVIRQGNKTVSRRLGGSSLEYLFPLADLQQLEAGPATVEISAYRAHIVDNVRKKFYILNGCRSVRDVLIL